MLGKLLNIILLLCCSSPLLADINVLPKWALGGFERPEGVNPLVSPVENTLFLCPMSGTKVKWECADTFNPAAVEKDGKVCVLYRAEDNPNVGIGRRTSLMRVELVNIMAGMLNIMTLLICRRLVIVLR